MENNYCVILAGGRGRRLWPVSRQQKPKQFVDFFGTGQSLLQTTYRIVSQIFKPENILVVSSSEYEQLILEQLPELPDNNIIFEPVCRNTAPSVALAHFKVRFNDTDATLMMIPSDSLIQDERAFIADVECGLRFAAEHKRFLALGVKPVRPEPGFGYLQMGEETATEGVYHVKSFTEKPQREFAEMFMQSGEFCWNTGIFIAHTDVLHDKFFNSLPQILWPLVPKFEEEITSEEGKRERLKFARNYVKENFPRYPNISLEQMFLENNDELCVMNCNFNWADLGTWHAMYDALRKSENDNVLSAPTHAVMDNSSHCIVNLPKGKLGIINSLDGYIVCDTPDVLLICKKEDSSALIRKYVNDVQMEYGEDYL